MARPLHPDAAHAGRASSCGGGIGNPSARHRRRGLGSVRESAGHRDALAAPLAFAFRQPVEDEADERRSWSLALGNDEEEALAVGSNVILGGQPAEAKERTGSGSGEDRLALYSDAHQLVVGGEVEELFSVSPPARRSAASGRDLPPVDCLREGL